MDIKRQLHLARDRLFGRGGIFHLTLNISQHREKIIRESAGKVIINVGSGNHRLANHIINIDISKRENVDVVADAHNLPFKDLSVDYILLLAILEHVEESERVIEESYRVLKDNGIIYCEFPFIQPEHNAPSDYTRVTIQGLRKKFRKFKEIDSGICTGPGSAVAWMLTEYVKLFIDNRHGKKLIHYFMSVFLFPLKYLDKFISNRKDANKIAAAVYFYGKK